MQKHVSPGGVCIRGSRHAGLLHSFIRLIPARKGGLESSETGVASGAPSSCRAKVPAMGRQPRRRGKCPGWTGVVGAFVCGLTPLGATIGAQAREGQELQTQLTLETWGLGLGLNPGGSRVSPSCSPLTHFFTHVFHQHLGRPLLGPEKQRGMGGGLRGKGEEGAGGQGSRWGRG